MTVAQKPANLVATPTRADGQQQRAEALSPRETEVLECLAKGQSYKEIADHLNVSYSTVHTYTARIYRKLRVTSRAQAVARWIGRL